MDSERQKRRRREEKQVDPQVKEGQLMLRHTENGTTEILVRSRGVNATEAYWFEVLKCNGGKVKTQSGIMFWWYQLGPDDFKPFPIPLEDMKNFEINEEVLKAVRERGIDEKYVKLLTMPDVQAWLEELRQNTGGRKTTAFCAEKAVEKSGEDEESGEEDQESESGESLEHDVSDEDSENEYASDDDRSDKSEAEGA